MSGEWLSTSALISRAVADSVACSDVFLRELMSNAHDALEKARLLSLTDSSVLSAAPQLNVSVMADPESNRIVIRGKHDSLAALAPQTDALRTDTGVGMSKEALVANLGTIA